MIKEAILKRVLILSMRSRVGFPSRSLVMHIKFVALDRKLSFKNLYIVAFQTSAQLWQTLVCRPNVIAILSTKKPEGTIRKSRKKTPGSVVSCGSQS